MSQRKGRLARRAKSRRLFVESLETRRLLAGDVSTIISGGSLLISGDADDNDISIVADAVIPGRITITPGGTTTLNGVALAQVFQSTGDIHIRMRGGADAVAFDGAGGSTPRDLLFNGDDGDNTFSLADYTVGRLLRVLNGDGFDSVDIANTAADSILVSNGDGGSTTSVSGATIAGGDLVIINGDDGGLGNAIVVDGSAIDGDLVVQNGDGATTIDIDSTVVGDDAVIRNGDGGADIALGAAGPVDIADDVFISNGDGVNLISFDGGSIGDDLTIRNGDGGADIGSNGAVMGGNVIITNGDGDNAATIDGADIADHLSIRNGDGDNSLTIGDGSIGRDLRVANGDGDYTVNLGDLGPLSIGGRVTIRNGDGAALGGVSIGDLTTGRDVVITNGDGDNSVVVGAFSGTADIGGTLYVQNGDGDNALTADNASIGGSLVIRNGQAATSHFTSLGAIGDLQVTVDVRFISVGDNFFEAIGVDIGRTLFVTTYLGDDEINLSGSAAAGDLTVGGSALIYTGDGDDLLTMGVDLSGATEFAQPVRIRMGRGDDDVVIGGATIIDALASSYDGGSGSDVITVTGGAAFDPFDPAIRRRIVNFELVLI